MLALALALLLAASANAVPYFTGPIQTSQCTGGQPCTVDWVDNGTPPTAAQIGPCTVGLYNGELNQVQPLGSVDVSSASSFTFTPGTTIGANGPYYIVFMSANPGVNYRGFTATFNINGLTGSTPSGSSTLASTLATTPTGSSASAGSSAPATTPSGTGSTPSDTTTPTLTTPIVTTTGTPTATTPITTSTSTLRMSTSASASALASVTPTSAAGRIGISSLVGLAALLVGVLAF